MRGLSGFIALLPFLAAGIAAGEHSDLRPGSQATIPTALIELDGTQSENPDGGVMGYSWTQIEGPRVELSDPTAAKPYFRTGKPGVYRFQLIVTANGLSSDPCIVELVIDRENQPPIAKAPAEVWGEVGKMLEIDGSESYDPEGEKLTYRWRPLTRGLDIPINSAGKPVLSFEPNIDGIFEIELVVSDGETVSQPFVTRVNIKPKPRPPMARAKVVTLEVPTMPQPEMSMAAPGARPSARIEGPAVAKVGDTVMLDARGSRGQSSARLEYLWRQKSGPFVSDFELVFDGAAERFRPPREGDYEFELVVSDGSRDSEPFVHKVRVMKDPDPPVAVVVAPARAMPGALVKMDATQSYDLEGSPLIYRWRQTGGPAVRNYVIDENIGDAAPAFHPPTPGVYSFELVVSNGKLNSKPVEIDIEVGEVRRQPSLNIDGPEVANAGDRLVLTVTADIEAGRSLTYVWRQVDGPAQALPPTNGPKAALSPPMPGRYIFDLSALESGKVVATARRTLEVFSAPNRQPQSASGAGLKPATQPVAIPAPPQQSPQLTPLLDMPAPSQPVTRQNSGRPAAQIHPSLSGGS